VPGAVTGARFPSVSPMCYKLSALNYGVVRANSACRIRGYVSHLCGVPVTFGIMA
jgi:hypothetical protein